MKFVILLFLFSCLFSGILFAENHMDLLTTITGDHYYVEMGACLATIDWNGDGYDDLVCCERNWKPYSLQPNNNIGAYGRLLIYFGGPQFDNIPDLIITGRYSGEFSYNYTIKNLGDLNGDGFDDLGLTRCARPSTSYNQNFSIYYAGAAADTIADLEFPFPGPTWVACDFWMTALGDINGDDVDDAGLALRTNLDVPGSVHFFFLYGGSQTLVPFLIAGQNNGEFSISGVGDLNHDGLGDFTIGYRYNQLNSQMDSRSVLYFGNANSVYSDSLLIFDVYEALGDNSPHAFAAGDTDGDGIDDLAAYFRGFTWRLYQGDGAFSLDNYLTMEPPLMTSSTGKGFVTGDFNHDGCSDILSTETDWSIGYGYAKLWLGGPHMDGLTDLSFYPPDPAGIDMYGYAATAGDFNGDGCDDVAIGAPFAYGHWPDPGWVFVYAGNTLLDDELPNHDPATVPPVAALQVFPNPVCPNTHTLTLHVAVKTMKQKELQFTMFNIKGQRVFSQVITPRQTREFELRLDKPVLPSGVYLCSISQEGKTIAKRKLTVIR